MPLAQPVTMAVGLRVLFIEIKCPVALKTYVKKPPKERLFGRLVGGFKARWTDSFSPRTRLQP